MVSFLLVGFSMPSSVIILCSVAVCRYRAPEVDVNNGAGHYTKAVDIFSFGRLVAAVLGYCIPCINAAMVNVRRSMEEVRDACTQNVVLERPTATNLLDEPCFVGLDVAVRARCGRIEAAGSAAIPWAAGPVLNLRPRDGR